MALQGDFAEHEAVFRELGHNTIELRQKSDLTKSFDALVLPGGESTVQGKLLRELDMFDEVKRLIESGLPVMATCAGVILLAEQLLDDPVKHLALLKVAVRRNAYGRQLSSFYTVGTFAGIKDVPMSFIRAPQIEFCVPGVEVLAEHDSRIAEYFINEML
jgi:5'-phosphate synthase pdxT subunit